MRGEVLRELSSPPTPGGCSLPTCSTSSPDAETCSCSVVCDGGTAKPNNYALECQDGKCSCKADGNPVGTPFSAPQTVKGQPNRICDDSIVQTFEDACGINLSSDAGSGSKK
jgi:hypothetical protein